MNKLLSKSDWISRIALFSIYVWFGFLKVIDSSPAYQIVVELQEKTLPFIDSDIFFIGLGVFEMGLGIAFLFPKLTKWTFHILLVHMFTTFGPLLFLLDITWSSFGALTLEGQYIVKNLALVALAVSIYDHHRKKLKE